VQFVVKALPKNIIQQS